MCATCGCSSADGEARHVHEHPHEHGHPHAGDHEHPHAGGRAPRRVRLEVDVLAKNAAIAAQNRALLARRGVLAVNLVSSPGSGKTTLLERTLRALSGEVATYVVEGDQETPLDAERIRAVGCPVVQINTGRGCHLDAEMVARALAALDPAPRSLLFIENVGNLVCPALFDLGEAAKIVVASTPEGEEKPLKYPHMFRASRLMLLNKVDLSEVLRFDAARCEANARGVNPRLEVIPVSATRGDGVDRWFGWLRRERSRTLSSA